MSYCTPDDVNFQSGVIRLFDRSPSCTGHPDEPQNRGGMKSIDPTEILLSRCIREAQN